VHWSAFSAPSSAVLSTSLLGVKTVRSAYGGLDSSSLRKGSHSRGIGVRLWYPVSRLQETLDSRVASH
jgi:hypothetical protein